MYRGSSSGGFMCCGDRNGTLCSECEPGKVVQLLKRDNTTVESKQLKQLVSCGAHTCPAAHRKSAGIPHLLVRDWTEPWSRVHPLTWQTARHHQGRAKWDPYMTIDKSSHGSSRDGCPRRTQYFTTHNAFYLEPGLMRERSSGMEECSRAALCGAEGSKTGQRKPRVLGSTERGDQPKPRVLDSTKRDGATGHTDIRWYSSAPMSNGDVIPFRRKKNDCVQGVSWTDDEYWSCWHGWDEVIDWGDELTDRAVKGPTQGPWSRENQSS